MKSRTFLASPSMHLSAVLLTFALIMMTGSSQAQTKHVMAGTWEQHRGIQPIPIAGNGVVPGSGSVTLSGLSPATLKIPAGVFGGVFAAQIPLNQATLVQLTTQFVMNGPFAAATLKKSAFIATRAAQAFAFCPGQGGSLAAGASANPNCVDFRSTGQGALPSQGTKHGLVRYSSLGGGNFGGTMQMTLTGPGSLSARNPATPSKVTHQLIGAGTGPIEPQAVGGGYNLFDIDTIGGGPVTTGGVIGTDGLIIPPGGNVVGTGPGATNANHGFAWTTGTVYVHGTAAGYPQPPTTVTLQGSDGRNPNGIGPITLVAGAVSHRLAEGSTFLSYDTVSMRIGHKVPGLSTLGLVIVAALLLATAGFMMRRQET